MASNDQVQPLAGDAGERTQDEKERMEKVQQMAARSKERAARAAQLIKDSSSEKAPEGMEKVSQTVEVTDDKRQE